MIEPGRDAICQTLQGILDKNGEKIKLELHQILTGGPKSAKDHVESGMSGSDRDMWDRFAVREVKEEHVKPPGGREGETWAVVAKNIRRGIRRAVKDLPEDDE